MFKVKLEGIRVIVSLAESDETVFECYRSSLRATFVYQGDQYCVFCPSYYWLDEGVWQVYKLVPASERT